MEFIKKIFNTEEEANLFIDKINKSLNIAMYNQSK